LSLTANCTITGIPSSTSGATTYTIYATNTGGTAVTQVTITVLAAPAPATISYASNPATYAKNTPITANVPSWTGGMPTSYSVSPALPTGLNLNTSTGIITGTPANMGSGNYTITGTNAAGSAQVTLSIIINDQAPTGLTYLNPIAIYSQNLAATPNTVVSSTGGAISSYSISPSLPSGLNLNTSTGTISGTPSVASGATAYTVTASNVSGSATTTVNISVAAPVTGALTPNVYAYVTDATVNAGTAVMNVDTTTGFAAGDKVLVVQSQDFAGTNNSGTFEYATVSSLTATQFTFSTNLTNTYYSGAPNTANAQVTQVIRVVQYTDLQINSGGSITPTAWNGSKGGFVVLNVSGQLVMNGTGAINANASGFRGTMSKGGESQLGLGVSGAGRGGGGSAALSFAFANGGAYGTSAIDTF
jgi:hypothetical protein